MKETKTTTISLLLALFLVLSACQEASVTTNTSPSGEPAPQKEAVDPNQDFLLEPGALLGIHFGFKKEEVTTQETRNFLRYTLFPTAKGKFPGSQTFYARPDRGERLGSEVLLWIFQDQPSRDQYFPAQDFPTQKYEEIWEDIKWTYADTTFFKYFQYGWQTSGFSTDYQIVAVQDEVEKEWLEEEATLVIEHFKLRPNADSLAFLNFLQSEWNEHGAPDNATHLSAIMYASRGYLEGHYARLTVFNTIADRNKVFPYVGKPQNDTAVDELDAKLEEYLVALEDRPGHYEILY